MTQRRAGTIFVVLVGIGLVVLAGLAVLGASTATDVDVTCRPAAVEGEPIGCAGIESILPDAPTVLPADDE